MMGLRVPSGKEGRTLGCYRLFLVVDVLSGESPEEIAHDWVRRHGDVLHLEVLDDATERQEAAGPAERPDAGPHGEWLDA